MSDTQAPERILVAIYDGKIYGHNPPDDAPTYSYFSADAHAAALARIDRLEMALCGLLKIHTRIMGDTHWRTSDKTLWPDACDAGRTARAALAEQEPKT